MYKVMIAEDESVIQKGLAYLVDWAALGCAVAGVCADGEEGLAFIGEHRPDIILTDVRMPLMDGIEMLNRARGLYEFEAIIISGYDDFKYASRAIQLDVSAYLLKPIDREELSRALAKVLRRLETRKKLQGLAAAPALLDARFIAPEGGGEKSGFADRAVAYIAENYNRPIQTVDLCDALGVSKTLLNQRFKEATGHTVNSFVNRYRITKAIELMRTGDMRLSEVAEAVGFNDYKYFFEVFRKYVGIAPSDFINDAQNIL